VTIFRKTNEDPNQIYVIIIFIYLHLRNSKITMCRSPSQPWVQDFIWKGLEANTIYGKTFPNLSDDRFANQAALNTFLTLSYRRIIWCFEEFWHYWPIQLDCKDYITLEQALGEFQKKIAE
jgi:hypothetical protein